jgi:hypothetical protein
MVSYNKDRTKFPMRLHTWNTFILSFHRDNFCYSGHCNCHNQNFDGKKMPYELLTGTVAEHISQVKLKGQEFHKLKHILPKTRET